MRPIERGFETAQFLSRWLLAPFLVGLALTLILLLLRFFADFYHIAVRLPGLTWHELIVDILNMIDIVLTANLVLIVVFSGYENFLHKVEARDHEDWPEGLTAIDFGALKQRVMGSIAVIAAVDALACRSLVAPRPTAFIAAERRSWPRPGLSASPVGRGFALSFAGYLAPLRAR